MKTRIPSALFIACIAQATAFGQLELGESIILTDSPVKVRATPVSNLAVVDVEVELVRERYADGKIRVERQVAMDERGDFVNHGTYREYAPTSDLVLEGQYVWGERTGSWMKRLSADESKKLQGIGAGFKAPFVSTAEFAAGKMNGIWIITDQSNHILAQIELKNGRRHGQSVFFAPNGEIRQQATFIDGILDGAYVERQDGKPAKEDRFVNGRRIVKDIQKLPNGSPKSDYQFLSPINKVGTLDRWEDSTIAAIVTEGEQVMHGDFVTYYDNGTMASRGKYTNGKLDGRFESWHRTGEVAVIGTYAQGDQAGEWTWRHANGMRQAIANYVDGTIEGKVLAWDESGKAVSQPSKPVAKIGGGERDVSQKPTGTSNSVPSDSSNGRSAVKKQEPIR